MRQIIIVGAGAAGLMAAGTALKKGAEVTLFEHNSRPARKVMITGKGRCNLTNNTDLNGLISAVTGKNGRFLYSAFSALSATDTMALFESLGVGLKTERGNRVFPESDRAVDVVDALVKYADKARIINVPVTKILTDGEKATGVVAGDKTYRADAVIIATGGLSYPKTGSTGAGYGFARELGHTVIPPVPSLVPLETHEGFVSRLSGLSLKNVTLNLYKNDRPKPIFSEMGEMLFTHFGVSGPLVLSASTLVRDLDKNTYRLTIDLKPALSHEKLDARLLRDFEKNINKDLRNSLFELLPKSLIPEVIGLSGINPQKKINEITKPERQRLAEIIKALPLRVTATRPIDEAIITAGGVKLSEINPKTCGSKLLQGLYFAGEILDVDAVTGGFNLQIAFSTGHLAGSAAADE